MIIVALYGGLGNQMFQYACGKAVSKKLQVELKLDISLLKDPNPTSDLYPNNYELDVFNIPEQIATIKEVRKYVPNLRDASFLLKKLYKFRRALTNRVLFNETTKFCFNNKVTSIKDNTYLYGYFQTEKYFENIRKELINTFSIPVDIDPSNQSLINEIKQNNSISIHVRRGDYLGSKHELLDSLNYYSKAIEIIKTKVEKPVFYIFSDDISWVEENFEQLEINKFLVRNNTQKSYLDMLIMSQCKHNICANSTFSWWAAWLNTNPEKIVISPKKWFNNGEFATSKFELIPANWLQL